MTKRPESKTAFDLGTSPHGLSANLLSSHQETQKARSLRLHAKLVLTLLLAGFFRAYCALCGFLCRIGAPPWLVNAIRPCIPDELMFAAVHAHFDLAERKKS